MRWFLGITALAAAVVGGVVGVGLLLPVTVQVSRETEIARPAATVYALVANLGAFPEYSPWRSVDPRTRYEVTGPRSGQGQRLTWDSDHPAIGRGEMAIARASAPSEVEIDVVKPSGGARSVFVLTPVGTGVRVAWTVEGRCPAEVKAVLCRYVALLSRAKFAEELELGLRQLDALARNVPPADFSGRDIAFVEAKPQTFAYVEGESVDEPTIASPPLRQSLGIVSDFFVQTGLAPAGPPIMLAAREERRWTFRAGFPFEGPAAVGAQLVKVGQTPAGPAVRAVHVGDAAELTETYDALAAFLAAHRLKVTAGPWEVYRSNPEGRPTTEIWVLID